MFKSSIRRLATEATSSTTSSTAFNISKPPSYTLAQLRSFPSLEPTKFLPLPTTFLIQNHHFVEIFYGVQ